VTAARPAGPVASQPTACPCERHFLEEIADQRDRGARLPHLLVLYTQTANSLERIRRSHFSNCTGCRGEDAAARSETE
jgi:hypothetical protein